MSLFDRWIEDTKKSKKVKPRKKVKSKFVKKTKKRKLKVVKKRVKKNRRNQTKFPALEKKYNLISRQELLDFDYLHKLNDKEKAWLNKFVEEEVNASFRHSNPLNKTKKQRKACYDKNNARNRCILTKNKVLGNITAIEGIKEASQLNPEQLLIGIQEKELEELKNLNNSLDSTENSQNSTKKQN